MSIKSKIESLIASGNATTGESDADLTAVMQTLVDGYGSGGEIHNQDKTVVPSESVQSITADDGYTGLGEVTVDGIPTNYVGSAVPRKASADLTVSGATVNVPSGYYSASASKAVASGSEGTPTATKETVSNHSVDVTPSVTNTEGYIAGGTKSGTAVNVSASELVSGTKSITENGTEDVTNYASVNVNVPNSYSASDEGKVVDGGALVAQGSATYTENGTYDTTLVDDVTVNVSGGYTADDFAFKTISGTLTINGSGAMLQDFQKFPITRLEAPNVTKLPSNSFSSCTSLTCFYLPNVVETGNSSFGGCTSLTVAVLPLIGRDAGRWYEWNSNTVFQNCSNLEAVDFGIYCNRLGNGNLFKNCSSLTTLVLRSRTHHYSGEDCIVGISASNTFDGTPFANGGTGGTIYIPEFLYNHLGDGSSLDYKAATNWSTLNGYGTITWAKIEGSYYETHYADGTAFS